jgi:alpha-N-arabinofuranosidase
VEKLPSLKSRNLKFIFDEWGVRFPNAAGTGMTRKVGMVTTLSYALFLHELFRHSDMVAASTPTAVFSQIVTDPTGDAVSWLGPGLVVKLMRAHFANARPLKLDGNSPQPLISGTTWLDRGTKPTGSPTYPLDVVAAFSEDRKKFILSVANPTVEGQELAPQINGVKLRGPGKLWQLAAPSVDSENEFGKDPVVKIVESSQPLFADKVQVPPISVSVYEFDVENA